MRWKCKYKRLVPLNLRILPKWSKSWLPTPPVKILCRFHHVVAAEVTKKLSVSGS